MLTRRVHGNGVVTYQSGALSMAGVVHGFSTRIGGISEGAFASLNLGNPAAGGPQDDDANLRANFASLQEALGVADAQRAWVRQVHGTRVILVEGLDDTVPVGETEADGMISTAANVLLTIRVADCVPVLLASADGQVVGAVHAGWRGLVAGIVPKAVRALGEEGVAPGRVLAAVGPAIGVEHFEVGEEVAAEFVAAGLGEAVDRCYAKPHVDLGRAIRIQLERIGVGQVDGGGLCTFAGAGDFYSHRRDNGVTGRMAGVIMARGC